MNAWQEIESMGFYPELVSRTLRRALGGAEPLACVFQVEAAFDHGSMFNHMNALAVSQTVLVQLHVDEQEDGTALIASAIHPIENVRGVSFMEVVAAPENGDCSTQEISIALNFGAVRRADVEPARCDDPTCTHEHGYQVVSMPDDVNMRISAAGDGIEAMARAERFIDVVSELMVAVREQ